MSAPKKHTGFIGFLENAVSGIAHGITGSVSSIGVIGTSGGNPATAAEMTKLFYPKKSSTKKDTGLGSSSAAGDPYKKISPYTKGYVYNAPMVKDAYFNPTPVITDDGVFGQVDLQAYNNAKAAWSVGKNGKVNAAKGAIQMDRYLWKSEAAMTIIAGAKKAGKPLNPVMNGFKFLYNPTTVTMNWGQWTYSNNQALLQGLDTITPAAPGSINSSVEFWVPLNRIQDMNYLNPDGSYLWSKDPLTQAFDSLYYEENKLSRALGSKKDLSVTPTLPYSYDVPISERKLIYEKGTMYDVEWLMKTINGWTFQDHVSDVSGLKTSDMGFLLQFPVELHLGNSLRYRVQITDIRVEHVIFNQRMVPIWSTVNLTCRRFPEVSFQQIAVQNANENK